MKKFLLLIDILVKGDITFSDVKTYYEKEEKLAGDNKIKHAVK